MALQIGTRSTKDADLNRLCMKMVGAFRLLSKEPNCLALVTRVTLAVACSSRERSPNTSVVVEVHGHPAGVQARALALLARLVGSAIYRSSSRWSMIGSEMGP